MTTAVSNAEAEAYLGAVREHLADLSDEDRSDLLEDLALHLAEIATDEREPAYERRLGPPAQYAAELRAAAGLPSHPAGGGARHAGSSAISERMSSAAASAAELWRHPWAAGVRAFLPQLRPAWWVLRSYLVVALPALWSVNGHDDLPVPTVGGNHVLGVVVVGAAIAASVHIGRREWSGGRRVALLALNAACAIGAISLALGADDRLARPYPVYGGYDAPPAQLMSPHGPVTNIRPYSRDGQPLQDVLLFDQDGRPLRVAEQEWWPDGCRRIPDAPQAADGVPVDFAYPRRYIVVPSPGGGPSQACDPSPSAPSVPLPLMPPAGESGTTTTTTPAQP